MRILLISRCPPYPLYLGDRLIVYHLAEELEARKHQLDLLAFTQRAEDEREQHHYDHRFQSVRLIPEPSRPQQSYLQRLLLTESRWPSRAEESWSPEMWRAIHDQLAHQDYDAIQVFGGVQVYEFHPALAGQPAIITPYESYSLYLRRQVEATPMPRQLIPRLQMALAERFESFMFTPYARTVVVSEPDRDELLRLNPRLPVDVIPNGVDTYLFRPRPIQRIPALLFVGNYEYPPNVDAALRLAKEIFPAVRQRLPAARLWLVGNAPPPVLQALASDVIRVTGRVPDVRPYLARAGVFVSPLRLGAGIKNKVLEALAMGCPVVATPLSVDGIAVREAEAALIADSEGLIEAAVQVLSDASLRDRLSQKGRHLIESRYSWAQVGERYEQLYRDIQGG